MWNEPVGAAQHPSGNLWHAPAPLDTLRGELRPLLPERAFLKRDRGDALLITNAPAFGCTPECLPGCIVEHRGMVLCILPDAQWVAEDEAAMPAPPDSRSSTCSPSPRCRLRCPRYRKRGAPCGTPLFLKG